MNKEITAKLITKQNEKMEVIKLRYRVYCQEFGWRNLNQLGVEVDQYDQQAIYFGAFCENKLVGTMRLVRRPGTFMVDPGKEYFGIGNGLDLRMDMDTAELSRLAVDPEFRTTSSHLGTKFGAVTIEIYRAVYQFCLQNGIRYLYIGSTNRMLRIVQYQLCPFDFLPREMEMEDGCIIQIACLDWRKFEEFNQHKRGFLLDYFRFLDIKAA